MVLSLINMHKIVNTVAADDLVPEGIRSPAATGDKYVMFI